MPLTLATAPTVEPISLTEAKNFLRIDIADDDALIDSLITAARVEAENITSRALITQTWDYFFDEFPSESYIEIPKPPLQSVVYLKYTDSDAVQTTWGTGEYIVDTDSIPGRVALGYSKSYPSFTAYPVNPIVVRFIAGYGDASADIPKPIYRWLLAAIAYMYERRQSDLTGFPIGSLQNYREFGF